MASNTSDRTETMIPHCLSFSLTTGTFAIIFTYLSYAKTGVQPFAFVNAKALNTAS